jgi:hypothetical protein
MSEKSQNWRKISQSGHPVDLSPDRHTVDDKVKQVAERRYGR